MRLCLLSLLLSLATARADSLPSIAWKPLFQGVSSGQFTLSQPRLIAASLLKIDLTAPGLTLFATPDNGAKPGETDGLLTSTFLKKYHLQAAINAAPYDPVPFLENGPEDIVGLQISDGTLVSPADRHPALFLSKAGRASILAPPFEHLENYAQAVGGFQIVLKNGTVLTTNADLHPRTAVGLFNQGQAMLWMVIDGRQPGYSEGATTAELGTWLAALGCTDGINLDGGGTSTLVIENSGQPQLLNRPIHLGLPGQERVAGSHLGLKAQPVTH